MPEDDRIKCEDDDSFELPKDSKVKFDFNPCGDIIRDATLTPFVQTVAAARFSAGKHPGRVSLSSDTGFGICIGQTDRAKVMVCVALEEGVSEHAAMGEVRACLQRLQVIAVAVDPVRFEVMFSPKHW